MVEALVQYNMQYSPERYEKEKKERVEDNRRKRRMVVHIDEEGKVKG